MLHHYEVLPTRYKAHLINGGLSIEEISPHIYMRVGTHGTAPSKLGAVEILKMSIMTQFQTDMKRIDWQAQQFVKELQ